MDRSVPRRRGQDRQLDERTAARARGHVGGPHERGCRPDEPRGPARRRRRERRGRRGRRGIETGASRCPGTLGAAMTPLEKLVDELERSYNEALERQADPAVYNDHREAAAVGRRLKELEGPFRLAQQWRQARADLEAARGDAELAEMA